MQSLKDPWHPQNDPHQTYKRLKWAHGYLKTDLKYIHDRVPPSMDQMVGHPFRSDSSSARGGRGVKAQCFKQRHFTIEPLKVNQEVTLVPWLLDQPPFSPKNTMIIAYKYISLNTPLTGSSMMAWPTKNPDLNLPENLWPTTKRL